MCSLLSLVVLGVSIAEQDVDPFAKNLRNDRSSTRILPCPQFYFIFKIFFVNYLVVDFRIFLGLSFLEKFDLL
jgi:hypothetical protein